MICITRGSLPEKLAISQRLTNIATAAIQHGLLAVDFPIEDCDFPDLW